jgi:ATP-dependent Clp protease adaptor protein ClpS
MDDNLGPALPTVGGVPTGTATEERTSTDEAAQTADPWVTIVWNDPVNLMSYVTYVFESYFGHPHAKAEKLMRQVHEEGRAAVSSGSLEQMEVDVQAMHSFGLWATLQRSGS